MHIAYVSADRGVPTFGRKGSSVHVQEVVRALRGRGASVTLLTARTGGDPSDDLREVPVVHLPRPTSADRAERESESLGSNPAVAEALAGLHACDAVYERYSLWSHAPMEWARASGLPGVIEVNAPLIDEDATHRGLVHRELAEQVARRAFDAATVILAVSAPVADWVASRTAHPERIAVVPNGVDPSRFAPRPCSVAVPETLTVGFVGTLKPWHGVHVLVEAMAQLVPSAPALRLLIVGDGPCRRQLEDLVQARGLAHVTTFTGAVDPAAIPEILSRIDIGVAPYTDAAGCYFSPLKLYEYMAAGVAVVASRAGQVSEVVRNGVTGLLCRPADAAALAGALAELVAMPERRRALAIEARRVVIRHHTWDGIAASILARTGAAAMHGAAA